MTIHELKDKLVKLKMQDRFTRETELNPLFGDGYTSIVKSNHFGKGYYLLDLTADPNRPGILSPKDLLRDLELEDSKGVAAETTDVAFYAPSMGIYPVLDIRRTQKDAWVDGVDSCDFIDIICADEPVADKSKKEVNEAIEEYMHPGLEAFGTEYEPTVYYACYTLDNKGDEDDHFDDFDLFGDAVSACKQKTNESHQATHICAIFEDESSYEAWEFKRSHGLSNYEVVAEFLPDPGEGLIEKSLTQYKRCNKFMASGRRNK